MRPPLLYISVNDGSDTRIIKEIQTLVKQFRVDLLGIGLDSEASQIEDLCENSHIVHGKHSSLWTLIKYNFRFLRIMVSHRYNSIHVVNEQNYLLLIWYLVFKNNVVLDVFDSMFLKRKVNFIMKILRDGTYARVKQIIVTDTARKQLVPERFHFKTIVIPNYPLKGSYNSDDLRNNGKIRIFYYGSLHIDRGTRQIAQLIDSFPESFDVEMAGWLRDEETSGLAKREEVKYHGLLSQKEALDLACKADYLWCLYAPNSRNNIYASPNKIWDGVMVETPVIINEEVRCSDEVSKKKLGVVIAKYDIEDYEELRNELIRNRNTFSFSNQMKENYTWEAVEEDLIKIHQA